MLFESGSENTHRNQKFVNINKLEDAKSNCK